MSDIGQDLKDVFAEVGVAYTILRSPANITGEYLVYKPNRQVTKPFTIEHQLEIEISFDSALIPGDTIQLSDGRIFLIAHMTPNLMENQTISHSCQIYKCNAAVTVSRAVTAGGGFDRTPTWSVAITGLNVLLDAKDYGSRDSYTPRPTQGPERDIFAMYAPKSANLLENDRIIVPGGLHGKGPGGEVRLRLVQFDDWTYRGLTIAYLGEDSRA